MVNPFYKDKLKCYKSEKVKKLYFQINRFISEAEQGNNSYTAFQNQ